MEALHPQWRTTDQTKQSLSLALGTSLYYKIETREVTARWGGLHEKVSTPDCKTIPEKEANGKDSMRREASKRAT